MSLYETPSPQAAGEPPEAGGYRVAMPPLPVLLRVPRYAEEQPAPAASAEGAGAAAAKPRGWGRWLLARAALAVLLGAAAAPWVARWRPWEELAGFLPRPHGAEGVRELAAPPPKHSSEPEGRPARAPVPQYEPPHAAPEIKAPAAVPRGNPARLAPDIIPLEGEKGGSP